MNVYKAAFVGAAVVTYCNARECFVALGDMLKKKVEELKSAIDKPRIDE
jgi:hypothetical protein